MSLRLILCSSLAACATAWTLPLIGRSVPRTSRVMAPAMGLFDGLQAGFAKLQAGEYDEEEIRSRVDRQIKMKPCVMYGMASCSDCQQAKKLLGKLGAVHTYVDFEEDDDGRAIQAELIGMGYSSFPAIFAGGKKLDDIVKMHANGQLEPALTSAGSLVPTQRI